MITYKFRLKSKNTANLVKMADAVNFVWNYANQTSIEYLDKHYKWLSGYDLGKLIKGCSTDLGINYNTAEATVQEYARRRLQFKRRNLAWRSRKRSLGWIPFKHECICKLKGDSFIYRGKQFRFWKSREVSGRIKSGSFSQDSKGHWCINFVCDSVKAERINDKREVGIDLGLKTLVTLSDGNRISRETITAKYAEKLAIAQRARKKKRVTAIHAKIKNVRKDFNHKETTKLVNNYGKIFVGDVSPSKLKRTRFAKSVSDASWADFKSMLAYKAIALGVEYKEVKENFSTVTCSVCFKRTGPSGLSALGVREWICTCGATHNRDVNAAKNILRFGHETLKGAKLSEVSITKETLEMSKEPSLAI